MIETRSYCLVAMEIITGDDPDVNVLRTYLLIKQKEQWRVVTLLYLTHPMVLKSICKATPMTQTKESLQITFPTSRYWGLY